MTVNAKAVALAICRSCKLAGQACGIDDPQPAEVRAENLLHDYSPYGPYIEDGDPKGWGGGGDTEALVTIYMEPKGGNEDCILPLDYWEGGFDIAAKASDLLPGTAYIEFVNPAVALVWP